MPFDKHAFSAVLDPIENGENMLNLQYYGLSVAIAVLQKSAVSIYGRGDAVGIHWRATTFDSVSISVFRYNL